ncbi:hypothetical protein D3C71_1340130 [compost metagenome]
MQIDFLCAALGCHLNHCQDVIFVAVNATGREQTHDVNGFTGFHRFIHRASQRWVAEESPFFNFNVQTGQVLINNTTRAQVDVSNFGVAHLTVWQANFQARSVNQGMRAFGPQCIHDRGFSVENGVILAVFAIAITIQNHQYHRFFRDRHCDILMLKRQKICLILLQLNR